MFACRSRTGVSSDSDVDEDSDGGGPSNNWEYPTVRGNAVGNGANGTASAIIEQRDVSGLFYFTSKKPTKISIFKIGIYAEYSKKKKKAF